MRSQAIRPQSSESNSATRWSGVLQQAQASQNLRSKRSMVLASACVMAILLPTTLSTQSNAQSETSSSTPGKTLTTVTNVAPLPTSQDKPTAAPAETSKAITAPQPAVPTVTQPVPVKTPKLSLHLIVSGQKKDAEIEAPSKMTVGTALKAAGITLNRLDRVYPEAKTVAYDGLTVRVQRVTNNLSKRYTSIPAQLLYRPTSALNAGVVQQIQAPRAGKVEIVERVWTLDGKETGREFVSKRLSVAPQPRVIGLGARPHVLPQNVRPHRRYASAKGYLNSFRGGSPRDRAMSVVPGNQSSDITTLRPLRSIDNVVTTGYAAGRAGGGLSNWTATGVRCTYGAIAVDPRLIPLGTPLYVEGYGYGFACDTGGAIKGKHIDLAFDSPRAAMNHGKRRARVWILGR